MSLLLIIGDFLLWSILMICSWTVAGFGIGIGMFVFENIKEVTSNFMLKKAVTATN